MDTTTSKCLTPHGQRRPGRNREQRVERGDGDTHDPEDVGSRDIRTDVFCM
jgi:hypothetical protein